MKWSRYIITSLLFIIAIGCAWYVGFRTNFNQTHIEEDQSAIMNKVQEVFKFIAVEGQVSEIYSYKDYYYYDIGPFRKKALIKVNAKVSIGYDFEKLNIQLDERSKKLIITELPSPEILSLDHDLEYYDVDEGTFNSFSSKDLTKLNVSSKNYISKVALESDLYKRAEMQKEELFDMIRFILEPAGWELVLKQSEERLLN
jgi:hypothetical protein